MSEDQIRAELSEMRVLIREGHAELVTMIRQANSEVLISVQARNNELKEDNTKRNSDLKKDNERINTDLRSTVIWIVGLFIVISLSFTSYVAVDHYAFKSNARETLIQQQKDLTEVATDFGTVLKITSPAHYNCLGFLDMVDKYFPSRGVSPNEELKMLLKQPNP